MNPSDLTVEIGNRVRIPMPQSQALPSMSLASLQTNLLGTRLTLWLGMTVAAPAPALIVEALTEVEVSLSDEGRDGFRLTFSVGRSGVLALDYFIVANPLLKPFNRVILQIWQGVIPQVLIDGFITKSQLNPSEEPGASTLTITGEDVRVLMDLHEVSLPYPNMAVEAQVEFILAKVHGVFGRSADGHTNTGA